MTKAFDAVLRDAFGDSRVWRDAPLAPLTTFKIGGPADWLLEVNRASDIGRAISLAHEAGVPTTILGGGSNVLVADAGIRGLVIRVHGGGVSQLDDNTIRTDAGVTINGLVRWTITRGLAGLETWAGTPGTVGGAVHGNAHFRGRLIGELIERVALVGPDGGIRDVTADEMEFGYDVSRLHRTREVVLSADFRTRPGDAVALRATARESLAFRKRTQPLESSSAGCIFQNPDPGRDPIPHGVPASAGALVDRAGLKGSRAGPAIVSARHANFIVNQGGATANQVRELIERCKRDVHARFGLQLREEIVYLGFND